MVVLVVVMLGVVLVVLVVVKEEDVNVVVDLLSVSRISRLRTVKVQHQAAKAPQAKLRASPAR